MPASSMAAPKQRIGNRLGNWRFNAWFIAVQGGISLLLSLLMAVGNALEGPSGSGLDAMVGMSLCIAGLVGVFASLFMLKSIGQFEAQELRIRALEERMIEIHAPQSVSA